MITERGGGGSWRRWKKGDGVMSDRRKKRIYEAPMTPVNIWNDGRREDKGLEEGRQKERERWREMKRGKVGSDTGQQRWTSRGGWMYTTHLKM